MIAAIIVLFFWNIALTIFLAEHIMETREHLSKAFMFIDEILDIIKESNNG